MFKKVDALRLYDKKFVSINIFINNSRNNFDNICDINLL